MKKIVLRGVTKVYEYKNGLCIAEHDKPVCVSISDTRVSFWFYEKREADHVRRTKAFDHTRQYASKSLDYSKNTWFHLNYETDNFGYPIWDLYESSVEIVKLSTQDFKTLFLHALFVTNRKTRIMDAHSFHIELDEPSQALLKSLHGIE